MSTTMEAWPRSIRLIQTARRLDWRRFATPMVALRSSCRIRSAHSAMRKIHGDRRVLANTAAGCVCFAMRGALRGSACALKAKLPLRDFRACRAQLRDSERPRRRLPRLRTNGDPGATHLDQKIQYLANAGNIGFDVGEEQAASHIVV